MHLNFFKLNGGIFVAHAGVPFCLAFFWSQKTLQFLLLNQRRRKQIKILDAESMELNNFWLDEQALAVFGTPSTYYMLLIPSICFAFIFARFFMNLGFDFFVNN